VRACVIFNPTAKGEKARTFRAQLDAISLECELKKTTAAGDARKLAAAAIAEGFELVIAAGGDGTVNEVLNGFGDAPDGFARACLGVFPLGTVNVFARELRIPLRPNVAWKTICDGREIRIDLPWVEFVRNGKTERSYFAQMAGAGLDARAIELVSWSLKKKIGPLAYVAAGMQALCGKFPRITVGDGKNSFTGELVLIGNGILYGGNYRVFRQASAQDGKLDVCVFPKARWLTLARCVLPLLLRGQLPESAVRRFQGQSLTLSADARSAFELDGELVGHLPARFSLNPGALRIRVP
jgi:diacylglycerol kinase (ATP)